MRYDNFLREIRDAVHLEIHSRLARARGITDELICQAQSTEDVVNTDLADPESTLRVAATLKACASRLSVLATGLLLVATELQISAQRSRDVERYDERARELIALEERERRSPTSIEQPVEPERSAATEKE